MGYSKAPEQPQSSARPICHSHAMTRTGREPATIRTAAYRSSPRYTVRHEYTYIYIYIPIGYIYTGHLYKEVKEHRFL